MAGEDLLREAQDPSTGPARLAEIAQADRSTWRAVAGHPQAYGGLLAWLDEHGDDEVRAAIAARAAASPPPPPPPPPPVPSVVTPPPPPPPAPAAPAGPPTGPPTTQPLAVPTGPPSGPPSGPPYADQAYGPPAGPPARRSSRGVAIWAVVAVVVLAALGVGGYFAVSALGDDDDTTTASAESTTTASDSSDPSSAGSSDASDDGGAAGKLCSTLKEQQQANMDLLSSPGADPDLDKLRDQLGESAKIYGGLADDAPEEISDDLRTIAEYYTTLQAVSDGSGDPSDFSSQMQPFTEASQAVTAYYYRNCD
jgi:hypothetical protein